MKEENSERQTAHMAARFKGQRKLQQLGKRPEACDEKKVPKTIIFRSFFLTKGEHSVRFPLVFCSLMILKHGMYFRQAVPLFQRTETCPIAASVPQRTSLTLSVHLNKINSTHKSMIYYYLSVNTITVNPNTFE